MFRHLPYKCPIATCVLNSPEKLVEQRRAVKYDNSGDGLIAEGVGEQCNQNATFKAIQKYISGWREVSGPKSPECLRLKKHKKVQGKARRRVLMRYISEETLKLPEMIVERLKLQPRETAYKHVSVILAFLRQFFKTEQKNVITIKGRKVLIKALQKYQKELKSDKFSQLLHNKVIVGKHWDKIKRYISSKYHKSLLNKIKQRQFTGNDFAPCLAAVTLEILLRTGTKLKRFRSLERHNLAMALCVQDGLVPIFSKNKAFDSLRKINPDFPPQADENFWLTKAEHDMLLKLSTFNHNIFGLKTDLAFTQPSGRSVNFTEIVHRHMVENIVSCQEMTIDHIHKQLELVQFHVSSLVTNANQASKRQEGCQRLKLKEAIVLRKTMGELLRTETGGEYVNYGAVAERAFRGVEEEGLLLEPKCARVAVASVCIKDDMPLTSQVSQISDGQAAIGSVESETDNYTNAKALLANPGDPMVPPSESHQKALMSNDSAGNSLCTDESLKGVVADSGHLASSGGYNQETQSVAILDIPGSTHDQPNAGPVIHEEHHDATCSNFSDIHVSHDTRENAEIEKFAAPEVQDTSEPTVFLASNRPSSDTESYETASGRTQKQILLQGNMPPNGNSVLEQGPSQGAMPSNDDNEQVRSPSHGSLPSNGDSAPEQGPSMVKVPLNGFNDDAHGVFCHIETMSYNEETDELEIDGFVDEDDMAHFLHLMGNQEVLNLVTTVDTSA